ncbi:MAG: divalent-cation tolerance protein CutA [Alphaproteobacteria bacterium]|nr:divalent-cation tolerance protein CutA [Alphaproteobacteria bacterium]
MQEIVMIYVTYPSAQEAEDVSRALLAARLVACANIMAGHRALFHWQGEISDAQEVVVIYKTRSDLFAAAEAAILERHSYDCPCVVCVPIHAAPELFLRWVIQETVAR